MQLFVEFSLLEDEEFEAIGHDPYNMALFCTFNNEECTDNDFYTFLDPRYGNCITFNSGRKSPKDNQTTPFTATTSANKSGLKTTSVTGPRYGRY